MSDTHLQGGFHRCLCVLTHTQQHLHGGCTDLFVYSPTPSTWGGFSRCGSLMEKFCGGSCCTSGRFCGRLVCGRMEIGCSMLGAWWQWVSFIRTSSGTYNTHSGLTVDVEFLRALGSQSVWCECVATYSGRLVVARSFIRQQQWQHSSVKLLS